MEHEHDCGCGHHHHHGHAGCGCRPAQGLREEEAEMLRRFASREMLPVASFVMASSAAEHCRAVALSPVLLEQLSDTLQDVRQRCQTISALMHRDLLSYREDVSVCGHIERAYRESEVFKYFEDTVSEGGVMPGFLFDTALLEMGAVSLTELGERALEA